MSVNINLLKKYDKPGPRYTSYPTAPLFSTSYTLGMLRDDLKNNNRDNETPLSLYIHIPFCDTLCYFCGCTTIITPNPEHLNKYVGYLQKEIELVSKFISADREVVQVHWGGGTPSYLSPVQIREIGEFIKNKFKFSSKIEYGVEIDPRGLSFDHMEAFRDIGMNRVSIGVQDFNESVQRAANRNQSREITLQTFNWAHQLGITSINADLIYGLANQTIASFEKTLDEIIIIFPERLAIFNFAYIPWLKPHQKLINQTDLPSPEEKLSILEMTIEKLTQAGYIYIGMDHFVKPTDEMAIAQKNKTLYRNFQGYSTNAKADLFGFGMSSISHFGTVYSQNHKNLEDYYQSLDKNELPVHVGYRMNRDDVIRKFVIMRLMCDLELDKINVEKVFDINFDEYFFESLKQLEQFIDEGVVKIKDHKIIIEDAGRLILRNIAMCFDAYINQMIKDKPVFSRTV